MAFQHIVAADRMAEERIARMRNSRSQFLQNGHHILSHSNYLDKLLKDSICRALNGNSASLPFNKDELYL